MNLRNMKMKAEKTQNNYYQAILLATEKEAIRKNLDAMYFFVFTTFYRDGKEVKNKRITALENLVCEYYPQGIYGCWTKERGWLKIHDR
jgi:hypothetical protein